MPDLVVGIRLRWFYWPLFYLVAKPLALIGYEPEAIARVLGKWAVRYEVAKG